MFATAPSDQALRGSVIGCTCLSKVPSRQVFNPISPLPLSSLLQPSHYSSCVRLCIRLFRLHNLCTRRLLVAFSFFIPCVRQSAFPASLWFVFVALRARLHFHLFASHTIFCCRLPVAFLLSIPCVCQSASRRSSFRMTGNQPPKASHPRNLSL